MRPTLRRPWQYRAGARLLALAALVLPASLTAQTGALGQGATPAQLTIANGSSEAICGVYIAAGTDAAWGEDRLGEETIAPGASYRLEVARGRYDVLLQGCDGAFLYIEKELTISRPVELQLEQAEICKTLSDVAAEFYNQSLYEAALAQLERALECFREIGDRRGEATTLNTIGLSYDAQSRYAQALDYYEQALAIQREIGDRRGEGTTLNNIGAVYFAQGRYSQALGYLEQALVVRREIGDRAGEGMALNGIGAVYTAQARYADAIVYYEQALLIRRETDDRRGVAVTLNNIGAVYDAQGRFAEALTHYEGALAIVRELDDRVVEATILNNIGFIYGAQGRYAKALDYYEQALAIRREVSDRRGESQTLNNIGTVYHFQGRHAEALGYFEQALTIRHEVGDLSGEGTTLSNIGAVYEAQGKYADALDYYERALAIQGEIGDRAGEANTLTNLGQVHHMRGQVEEALERYEQALELQREVGNRPGEAIALNNIGKLYETRTRFRDALAYYEEAMGVLESVRAAAGSDLARASFIGQYADLYSSAVALYHQEGRDDEVFITSERGRARAFLDSLSTGYVQLGDSDVGSLLAAEQEAYAVRQAAQEALVRAQETVPPDATLITDLETQLAEADEAYAAALAALEQQGEQAAQLAPRRQITVTVADVQAQLDEQTTLVSYWVLEEEQGSLAFVVTRDDFDVVALPDATGEALSAVAALREAAGLKSAHPHTLHSLYKWLVAPLETYLQTEHLLIVPHQWLHYVPFAALTDGEKYFGERHTLAVLPSAAALPFIAKNAAHPQMENESRPVLVFGNPAIDEPGLPALAQAAGEAQAVGEIFATPAYTGSLASEVQLRQMVTGTRILHLAAHGEYNQANALYSTIYLAPDQRRSGQSPASQQDGKLEAHEVYGLPLQGSELVVLSACETNVGSISPGDEVVGLTRAFFFAGAPTVIASLWRVDDAATKALMVSFYRHWQEGMSKAEALQAAHAEVRAHPGWRAPFYWAAFVLNGDGGR